MAKDRDIRLDMSTAPYADIVLEDGDMAIGDTLGQNMQLIVASPKGDWKQHPDVGAGAYEMVNEEDSVAWKNELHEQLRGDGMEVGQMRMNDNRLVITAKYRDL